MKITLDTNCLISLDTNDINSPVIRQIINLHKNGVAEVFIPAIIASENKMGGGVNPSFKEFEQFLNKIECQNCYLLKPIGYWGVTYWDYWIYGPSELEKPIHEILFPKIPFDYTDYCTLHGLNPESSLIDKNWRNAKCDVLSMWCHIHYGNEVFVTNDNNFHKATKKSRLIELGAREIIRPEEAIEKVLHIQKS